MATHHPERIAPIHLHNPSSSSSPSSGMQQFTVGKLDAGMAILLGSRASLIEFPSLLLPQDVTSGSVVEITVKRNTEQERKNHRDFHQLQHDILETYGIRGPTAPALRLRAVTQTSVVLEWSHLELATASLLSLDIYRNGARLAAIPNPLKNTSTKLSGLEVGADYLFHLVLKTTAGTLTSNVLRTKTHTMTDTSGIAVCFGAIGGDLADLAPDIPAAEAGEPITHLEALSRDLLAQMGAKASTRLQIDTTHYVCTSPRTRTPPGTGSANGAGEGPTYRKALQLNIPVVRPEWIVACWEAKRMVPISAYYIDQDPPNHSSVRSLLSQRRASTNLPSRDSRGEREESPAMTREDKDQSPPPPAPKGESTVASPAKVVLEDGHDVAPTVSVFPKDDSLPSVKPHGASGEAVAIHMADERQTSTPAPGDELSLETGDNVLNGDNAAVGRSEDADAKSAHEHTDEPAKSLVGSMEDISLSVANNPSRRNERPIGDGPAGGHDAVEEVDLS